MKIMCFLFSWAFVFVIVCTGCSSTEEIKIDPNTIKTVDDEIEIKNDPKSSFERFRRAALKSQWKKSYQELTQQWKENLSLSNFSREIQGAGKTMLQEPILSIYYSHEEDEPECHIITENNGGDKTIYRFIMEDNLWKMGGIKFQPREVPEDGKKTEG